MSTSEPESKSTIAQKFHTHFNAEADAISTRIADLSSTTLTPTERQDATSHTLASITRLSTEVQNATPNLPAHDQRHYADAVKALKTRLDEVRAAAQPKSKFSFKSKKNASAVSVGAEAELKGSQPRASSGLAGRGSGVNSVQSSRADTPVEEEEATYPALADMREAASARRPSFSKEKSVKVSGHKDLHIILPQSAAHATTSGTLSRLRHCVVDMSVPTASERPFAGLSVKDVENSLLVCGTVAGPIHVTGLRKTVLVVSCRQFRMHECRDCDVYLRCGSKPVIEGCEGIRFAELPESYKGEALGGEDRWSEVEDFNWQKGGHSPNWRVLEEAEQIAERVWKEIVPGGVQVGSEEILKAVGVNT